MKPRHMLASLGPIMLCMVLFVRAGDQPNAVTPSNAAQIKDELVARHQQLARQFEDFRSQLLRLKQRLDKGTPEERSRASALSKLLDQIQKDGLAVQFDQLSKQLKDSKLTNIPELKQMAERSAKLADRLRDYLEMFREDPRQKQLQEEKKAVEDFLKEVSKILDNEKRIQGLTEAGKTDPKELSKNQAKNAEKTNNLEKAIDKFLGKGDGLPQEAKDLKGKPKDGGKTEDAKAKTKDDGEKDTQTAQGQTKDAGDDKNAPPKGGAKGDESAKDDKGGDAQAKDGAPNADAKSKDGKGSDGESQAKGNEGAKKDEAGAKDNEGAKSSEASAKGTESPKGNEAGTKGNEGPMANEATAKGSEGPMSPKGNEAAKGKEGAKGSESGAKGKEGAKSSEGQAKGAEGAKTGGEPKATPSQAKAGEGSKAGAKDAKGSESGSQAKAGDPKGSPKGSQGKAKAGSESKSQASAKGDGSKSAPGSPGKPSEASAKDDPGAAPPPSGDPSAGNPPPGNPKTKDELAKNQKKLREAGYEMNNAEKKLADNKPKQALPPEEKAIQNLEEMKKNLEKLLRQTREEELERLLAQLEARCRKMLEMQERVLAGTEETYRVVLTNSDKKPARPEQLKALGLSDNEKDIISEANKAIQMLEEEGSAVAFPEVFQQVREDMKHVQRRLEIADTGEVTQAVEKDIIASLKEMIDALKKAQKDLDKQKAGKPGESPPPGDQKLLDKIAELKMIRSLQSRINDRTKFYGKLFPNEQAFDPNLRQQLQQLGERQERIFEIMDRFVKGDGK
jgi:hypothetical protein